MDADAILSRLTIPNPCPMDWDLMPGNDRVRHCGGCGKHVYNLTTMNSQEASAFISGLEAQGEKKCIRLYQGEDGGLLASGCQGLPKPTRRPWTRTIGFLMAVIAGCAAALGLAKWISPDLMQPKHPAPQTHVIMGDFY